VVTWPGATATPESLQTFVRERLAPHKVPREVRVVEHLPRTGSGKIDRASLREAAIATPAVDQGGAAR
jgi:acyl-coenzyme A synthetase/AMP-(fatty) acid ligase